jgi:diacylglycerol kinase family enzyme
VVVKDLCVIYNPMAGRGRAPRRLEQLRRALGPRADFQPTQGPGHAEELALAAAQSGFAVVAAAGGDGTVHEVANGVLRAGRPEVALAVFPAGSANDFAHSVAQSSCWAVQQDAALGVRTVDVGVVRGAGRAERYFVNGLGLGFNGAVTLESRQIRRLQGMALYGVALVRALWYRYACPLMTVRTDDSQRHVPTLALTVALGRREGGFVLAPHAQLDDGLFDFVHAGALSRWELIRYLPNMATGRIPTDHPRVWLGRCRCVRVSSTAPLTIHIDGEFFCRPEDGLQDVEIDLLPRALQVQRQLGAELVPAMS